jgi:hypothetical protein
MLFAVLVLHPSSPGVASEPSREAFREAFSVVDLISARRDVVAHGCSASGISSKQNASKRFYKWSEIWP